MRNQKLSIVLISATLLGAVLRIWGIWAQALTADERLLLMTANNYVKTGFPEPIMTYHPSLRNLLIYATQQVAGSNQFTIKVWSVVFGTFAVTLLGLLVWQLTHDLVATAVASVLLAVEPMAIYWSRSGLPDNWTVFWGLLGLLLTVLIAESRKRSRWQWWPLLVGVAFGIGVSFKFYVIPLEVAAIGYLIWVAYRDRRLTDGFWAAGAIGLTSFLIFVLQFTPWFAAGYSAIEWVEHVRALLASTSDNSTQLLFNRFVRAWQWFLVPGVGWQEMLIDMPLPRLALAVANPLTWLATLPAAFYLLWRHANVKAVRVFEVLFWLTYVPLLFAGRFIYAFSAVIVLPFAFALIGMAVSDLAEKWGRGLVVAYVGMVIVVSLALYPGPIGRTLDFAYLHDLIRYQSYTALAPPIQQQLDR